MGIMTMNNKNYVVLEVIVTSLSVLGSTAKGKCFECIVWFIDLLFRDLHILSHGYFLYVSGKTVRHVRLGAGRLKLRLAGWYSWGGGRCVRVCVGSAVR